MNSNTSRLLALLLLPGALWADRLSFHNGDLLTGAITAIDDKGRIVVDSPDAATPLLLRSDTLQSAVFQQEASFSSANHERVNLINGDVFPGTIASLDRTHVSLQTWYGGELRIPRSTVQSIDFGIAPSKLAYLGPGGPEGWLDGDEWRFSGNGKTAKVTSTGRGVIARPKVLPDNFILRFKLAWIETPNVRVHFCDDHLKAGGETDRYYFEINQAGVQLKRQASDHGRGYHVLYDPKRRPSSFDNNDVEVELRVDRTRHLIYIYIDGELEGRYPDLIDNHPEGNGIMLESNAGHDTRNVVSGIEIYHWDAVSQLHRAEGHEDTTMDAIITTDRQRYPGDVRKLVTEDNERLIILKNPHAKDLLRVPVDRTSVLYLRHEEAEASSKAELSLELFDHGFIHLSEPRLQEDLLRGRHPLLGEITIKRGALKRMQSAEPAPTDS